MCINNQKNFYIRQIRCVLLLVALLVLSGCFLPSYTQTKAFFGGKFKVEVVIAKNVNHSSPIAVDLIQVYDKDLAKQLLSLSAQEWFKKRDQFKQDFPEGTGFDSWDWEWVPNQHVSPMVIPMKTRTTAIIIFADYETEGVHRARIIPNTDIQLMFLDEGFQAKTL